MSQDSRICFLGDSFVNGTGDPTCLGWTGRVCAALAAAGRSITYYNLGIRGETSMALAQRWQGEATRRFAPGADNRLVFCFGTNDTTWERGRVRIDLADTLAHSRQILSIARTLAPVLLVSPPAIADPAQNQRTQRLCQGLQDLCADLSVPYIDEFMPLQQSVIWMTQVQAGDGAHPQAAGYEEWAQHILQHSVWQQWMTP
ncbi:GDSL-like Lipase/Acylhydrolase [Halomicronema hongdechloris C2206]|uniref:GDSL-like Lipase/Acylhydrolase n=1 Tax=Halomicronema hongdechloris C2206 TaxID=1641165 RepID=A0A1Z3HJ98_9CYAN|nr:GDSL-type esterase/lipase family protein [Halomicronema hongdechloris]ASC70187.1 GDSL-like Lipase/Acylhydrolase [Halomicronema hongdechloris C2206]